MRLRHLSLPAAAVAAALTLSACGAEVDDTAPSADGYPVTVTNCGEELEFTAPPERVLVNDVNMIETMFALGLEDRMAGYVLSDGHEPSVEHSPWSESFDQVPRLGSTGLELEMIQGADADLVFAGWNYGFTDTGVTPERLEGLGIDSYLLTESCRQDGTTARGIMDPIEALYTDLENLGVIFGVQDRAAEVIAESKEQVARAESARTAGGSAPRVFLYDGGLDEALTVGANAAGHQVMTRAGGENVFADLDDSWTRVSFEAAADRDPEVIVINDYGTGEGNTAEAKIEFLRGHPLMSGTTAVREGNFFVLPYSALTEGPSNPRAAAEFADYLAGEGL